MTAEPLTPEALDIVVKWLVAGTMRSTVNTPAEREALQYVTQGHAERDLDAARKASPPLDALRTKADEVIAGHTRDLNACRECLMLWPCHAVLLAWDIRALDPTP